VRATAATKILTKQAQAYIRSTHPRSGAASPEQKLAAAVFFQAINDLQNFRHQRRETGRSLGVDAHNWIASNNRSWPYSFLNICNELHLAADVVRAELLGDKTPTLN
jgi:hypothetical protein